MCALSLAVFAAAAASATASGRTNARLDRMNLTVSANWAGYVASGTSFSDVTAIWVEPTVDCIGTHPLDASSFWIGLGGASFTSPGLEQTGTSADCAHGRPHYYAWYEVLPAPATSIALQVRPGDTITAAVHVTSTAASFVLRNVTTGGVFSTDAPVRAAAIDSAEWIAEAPSTCRSTGECQTLPLAQFRAVLFTGATATAAQHTGTILDPRWGTEAIRLANKQGSVSALPSDLSPDGSSFSVATHGPRVKSPLRPTAFSPSALSPSLSGAPRP